MKFFIKSRVIALGTPKDLEMVYFQSQNPGFYYYFIFETLLSDYSVKNNSPEFDRKLLALELVDVRCGGGWVDGWVTDESTFTIKKEI